LADAHGIGARVVSMPCTSVFERQSAAWRAAVLPRTLPVVAVEAGHPDGLRRYVGRDGSVVGIARFGESAPGPELMAHFGISVQAVLDAVCACIAGAALVD
jgi:transketolase